MRIEERGGSLIRPFICEAESTLPSGGIDLCIAMADLNQ